MIPTILNPRSTPTALGYRRCRPDESRTAGSGKPTGKSGLLAVIQQYKGLQTNLSDEEIRLAKQRGVKKATLAVTAEPCAKLTVELEAESETDVQLRRELLNQ